MTLISSTLSYDHTDLIDGTWATDACCCQCTYILDVFWGQPIKLIQVASNSELRENQWNDLLFFEIVPSHCFRASEVQT